MRNGAKDLWPISGAQVHARHGLRLVLAITTGLAAAVMFPSQAGAAGPDNMGVLLSTRSLAHLPVDYGAVEASTVFSGSRGWGMYLHNMTSVTVTNPEFTIDSGYQALDSEGSPHFLWRTSSTTEGGWAGIQSFPATAPNNAAGTLPSGPQGMVNGRVDYSLMSDLPVTFRTGFDFSRTVTGDIVSAVTGGTETVSVSFTPRDPAFGTASPAQSVCFNVIIGDDFVPITFSDGQLPILPPGSDATASWALNSTMQPGSANLQVCGSSLQMGYAYQASVVVHVPGVTLDPGMTLPDGKYRYVPVISAGVGVIERGTLTQPSASLTIHDPLLDGGVAGRGGVTFSIDGTAATYPWTPNQGYYATVSFEGLRAPGCPMGGCATAAARAAIRPGTLLPTTMFATALPKAPKVVHGATPKKDCQVMHHTTTRNDATPFVLEWVNPKNALKAVAHGDILLTSC